MAESVGQRFRRFVNASRAMLEPPRMETAAFEAFVAKSRTLLFRDVEAHLPVLLEMMRPVLPLMATTRDADLLDLAGLTHREDPYTELLRWALWPGDDDIATACQRAWLAQIGTRVPDDGVKPETQVSTADGRPDLVLRYPTHLVIVEAKTGTAEHNTPGATPQTLAYGPATRARFELDHDFPTDVVFLTLDRSVAANGDAKLISYLETAVVLARALSSIAVPPGKRQAFDALLGHLASKAVPAGIDMEEVVAALEAWGDGGKLPAGRAMVTLSLLTKILPLRSAP